MTTSTARKVAVVIAVVAAAAGISALWSSATASTPPATPTSATTGSEIQAPVDPGYWTPDRIRGARPAPMPTP